MGLLIYDKCMCKYVYNLYIYKKVVVSYCIYICGMWWYIDILDSN